MLKSVNGLLHKLRVTFKWLLGALEGFDPATSSTSTPPSAPTTFATLAATHHLNHTLSATYTAYSSYEPYRGLIALTRYINTHLSAFYFEYSKDLLYAGTNAQRREVQAMCWEILRGLCQMLAPVCPLLVTEVVEHAPGKVGEALRGEGQDPFRRVWTPPAAQSPTAMVESPPVDLPSTFGLPLNKALTLLDSCTSAVKAAQEIARTARVMGSGLECRVELRISQSSAHDEAAKFLEELARRGELEALLVVSGVEVVRVGSGDVVEGQGRQDGEMWRYEQAFEVQGEGGGAGRATAVAMPPGGAKCPRCWRYKAEKTDDAALTLPEEAEAEPAKALCSRCAVAVGEQTQKQKN